MKRIHTLNDPMMAGHIEDVLKQYGIRCATKNRYLAGGVGDLPPIETWPEIWVINDRDAEEAIEILEALLHAPSRTGAPWVCGDCGELIEPQFDRCWACADSASDG